MYTFKIFDIKAKFSASPSKPEYPLKVFCPGGTVNVNEIS